MSPDDHVYRSRLLGHVANGIRRRHVSQLKSFRNGERKTPPDPELRRVRALIEDDELPTEEGERLLARLGVEDEFLMAFPDYAARLGAKERFFKAHPEYAARLALR